MDEKQVDLFAKAAEDLPQWVESLTREEIMEAVPGSTPECLGGEFSQARAGKTWLLLRPPGRCCQGVEQTSNVSLLSATRGVWCPGPS